MQYRTTRRQTRRALLAVAVAVAALPAAAAQAADVTAVGTEIVVEDKTGPFGVGATANRLIAESLPGGELRLVDQVPLVSKTDTCVNLSARGAPLHPALELADLQARLPGARRQRPAARQRLAADGVRRR